MTRARRFLLPLLVPVPATPLPAGAPAPAAVSKAAEELLCFSCLCSPPACDGDGEEKGAAAAGKSGAHRS